MVKIELENLKLVFQLFWYDKAFLTPTSSVQVVCIIVLLDITLSIKFIDLVDGMGYPS